MDQLSKKGVLVTLGSKTILHFLDGTATLYSKGNVETYKNHTISAVADPVERCCSKDYPHSIPLDQASAQKLKRRDKIMGKTGSKETYIVRKNRREEKNVVATSWSANSEEQSITFDQLENHFEIYLDGAEQHHRWLNRPLMPENFGANLNDNYDLFEDAIEKGIVQTVVYENVSDEQFAKIQTTTVQKTIDLLSISTETFHAIIKCPLELGYYYFCMRRKIDVEFENGQISMEVFMERHKYYEDYMTIGKHFFEGACAGVTAFSGALKVAKTTFGVSSNEELVTKIGEKFPIVANIVVFFGGETKFIMAGGFVALVVGGFLDVAIYKCKTKNTVHST